MFVIAIYVFLLGAIKSDAVRYHSFKIKSTNRLIGCCMVCISNVDFWFKFQEVRIFAVGGMIYRATVNCLEDCCFRVQPWHDKSTAKI